MSKEIITGNKLIAEILGYKVDDNDYIYESYFPDGYSAKRSVDNLKYHSSWDWLMPCWGKILSLGLKETDEMCIREPWGYMQDIRTALSECDINKTWQSITNLIQWYNSQKQ